MSEPRYQVNFYLDEQDQKDKEELSRLNISPRDTWRAGASLLLKTVDKEDKK